MALEAAASSGIDPLDDAEVDDVVAEILNALHLGLFVDEITPLRCGDGVVGGSLETVAASCDGAVSGPSRWASRQGFHPPPPADLRCWPEIGGVAEKPPTGLAPGRRGTGGDGSSKRLPMEAGT